ncbi:MAG: nucleotidyltransferase domain-containing protein [Nitrososphaerota archaeon]
MGEGEMGIFEERKRLRKAAIESAAEAVGMIERILGPVSAAVIGSYARGDFNEWSDVDLLVISPRFARNPLERFDQLIDVLREYPDLEIIPLTPQEFLRQKKLRTPMVIEAIRKGIIIKDQLKVLLNDLGLSDG